LEDRVEERTRQLSLSNAELQEAMAELRKTQQAVSQVEKMAALGRLSAGVGHELNNPMMGVLNYMEAIEAKTEDPELRVLVSKANQALARMREIIKGLMTYSHASSRNVEVVSVRQVIDKVVEFLDVQLRHADVELIVDIPDDLSTVHMNANELFQCLLNLIINALDAVKDSDIRKIVVAASNLEGCVQVDIIDSGPGISDQVRSKIFDPFFTTKEVGKGTGLGLSVSKNLIESYGGNLTEISAGEEQDQYSLGGAHFSITLESTESK